MKYYTLEQKRIDCQLDVLTTIYVKSFLNRLSDDSTSYYRTTSRYSAIILPSSILQLSIDMARRHVPSFRLLTLNSSFSIQKRPFTPRFSAIPPGVT